MSKLKDLTGMTFGKWKVIERKGSDKYGYALWLCECQCEKRTKKLIRSSALISGESKSCGCLQKELAIIQNTTHGKTNSHLYSIWRGMRDRIFNKNARCYKDYGGRGIKICDEWLNFENFYEWSINNGYQDDLTIERKDVNGNYCLENCKWATMKEQANNRRTNHFIEFNGKNQSMSDWAKEINIPYQTLKSRINSMGWEIERALTTPVNKKRGKDNA